MAEWQIEIEIRFLFENRSTETSSAAASQFVGPAIQWNTIPFKCVDSYQSTVSSTSAQIGWNGQLDGRQSILAVTGAEQPNQQRRRIRQFRLDFTFPFIAFVSIVVGMLVSHSLIDP